MRALRLAFLLVVIGSATAFAALQFSALAGRVVDEARVLSPDAIASLDQALADYERGTSNQVVVVTIPSLQGTSIEDYGYQLGRQWQLGQKGKNNGALLLVAPNERKVRIEVGYGLEPLLTDAASSEIVQTVILPAFREGRMEQGIVDGAQAMLSVLGGKGIPPQASSDQLSGIETVVLLLFIFWFVWFGIRHPFMAAVLLSSHSSRFGRSGRSGGFSGRGGSFGGGGASGSW
jgi:uncharacterized protein